MKKRVAVLVDGTFFIKRYFFYFQKNPLNITPQEMATAIHTYCLKHIRNNNTNNNKDEELYRIFFYDCKPLKKKAHYPLSKGTKAIDLEKSAMYIYLKPNYLKS